MAANDVYIVQRNSGDTEYTERILTPSASEGHVVAIGASDVLEIRHLSVSDINGLQTDLDAKLDDTQRGAANGVASLDSGGKVPTSELPDSVIGGVIYQGTWNASTNTPTITSSSGTQGHYYRVATAGTTTVDGVSEWAVGDWIVFNGSIWEKIDNTESVISVAGQTGEVTLAISDITNLQTTLNSKLDEISATTGYIPTWASSGAALGTGYAVVTTLGTPGNNGNLPTEAAVRAAISASGGGDVSGPTSSVDTQVAVFSGTSGKTIDNSATTISLAGSISVPSGQTIQINSVNVAMSNDSRFPTSDEKAALAGTGTPSGANVFVTNDDSRLTNARNISWVATPGTPGASGTAGTVARDDDYFYVCVATNDWKRVPLSGSWT